MKTEYEHDSRSPRTRAEAIEIIAEIEQGAWSDRLLAVREARFDDPRERRFLHVLVLGALRWQGALDKALEPFVHGGLERLQPAIRAALRVGLAQSCLLGRPPAVAVDATVHAAKTLVGPRPAGLINAVLRQLFGHGVPPLDERATVPAWMFARWSSEYGAATALEIVRAINRPAKPFLVARPDRGGRAEIAEALLRQGVETRPSRRHPWGLGVTRGAPQNSEEFGAGDIVILDEAAALVALLATPHDERPVLDLAAAPGGKAALLALRAPGPLLALELFPQRAGLLADTLARRAPYGRARAVVADALQPPVRPHSFGTVLLDAPCTGTGTLRRRPEKRARLRPADIADCADRQRRLLDAAAELVAPGGALVYAVCSLEPEEGRLQAEAFLERHPRFRVTDPSSWLGDGVKDLIRGAPPALVTRPDTDEMEGFFAIRFDA